MTTSSLTRGDRIKLRTTSEEKRLLASAAERIVLSERDSTRMLRLLESPPKPTKVLLAAVRRRTAK